MYSIGARPRLEPYFRRLQRSRLLRLIDSISLTFSRPTHSLATEAHSTRSSLLQGSIGGSSEQVHVCTYLVGTVFCLVQVFNAKFKPKELVCLRTMWQTFLLDCYWMSTEFRSRILSSRKRGLAPRLAFCSQIFEFWPFVFFQSSTSMYRRLAHTPKKQQQASVQHHQRQH